MKKFTFICMLCATMAATSARAAVVLTEDFAKFTKGSVGEPALDSPVAVDGTISADLTQTAGWTGTDLFQAGGTAYLQVGTGMLTTPALDLSGNEGGYVIKFKAKADAEGTFLMIMDYMNPTGYGFSTLTTECADYEVPMTGGTAFSQIAFPAMYGAFYIDDIVIDDGGVSIPALLPASDYTRDSFTANWEAAAGADSYALNVYTLHYNTTTTIFEREYLLEGFVVEGTSHVVEGIDFGTPYYYTVCGRQGTNVTQEQERPMTAIPTDVAAPTAFAAYDISKDGFTGSWSASDLATVYAMHVIKVHTAAADGDYDLVDTDFSYFQTEGTPDAPQKELEGCIDGDWQVAMPAYAKGMLGLNNQDFDLFGAAMLVSPVFDMSVGSGTVKISLDAMGRKGLDKASMGIAHYNAAGGIEYIDKYDFVVSETMQTIEKSFTGADQNSFVVISSDVLGILFIDNLKVSIDMRKDQSILVPVRTYETAETSQEATNLGIAYGDLVGYYVTAIYRDNGNQLPEVESERSNAVSVDMPSGVEDISGAPAKISISVTDGVIKVKKTADSTVAVYAIDGSTVFYGGHGELTVCCRPSDAGIYIVKVGADTFKIVID